MVEQKDSGNIEISPTTPEWFTQNVLEEVLQKKYSDKGLKIVKLKVSDFGKGDNYASMMKRVYVEYIHRGENNSGDFLLKSCYENDEFLNNILSQYNVYNLEMRMYDEILPKMTQLLRESKDIEQHSLFPETIAVFHDKGSILFEDLTKTNFVMEDRLKGLNLQKAKLILTRLAKMHATSAVLNEREPNIFKGCDRGIFNRHTRAFSPYFETVVKICGEMVSKWEGYEHIGEKILKIAPHFMEYTERVYDPEPNQLNVLTHGDLWTNNTLFKYVNGETEPSDSILIDFQFCSWGSPASDLSYFFNTSLQRDLLLRTDELIQHYYYDLSDTLRKLGFLGKIPSLTEFRSQLMLKSFSNFTISITSQPVMLNPDTEDADFHAVLKVDERGMKFKRLLFSNPVLQENLKIMLPVYDRMGLFELQ
ncbi:hypothetical protein ACFFRR_011074 [Megaselia abdita]